MATPFQKPFQRIPTNYQDEFIQQINERYSLAVSPNTGKNRNSKSSDGPRATTELPQNNLMNKTAIEQQPKMNRKRSDHQTSNKIASIKINRKRKFDEADCTDTQASRKKRKLESITRKLKQKSQGGTDKSGNESELGPVKNDVIIQKNHKLGQIKKREEDGGEIDKNSNFVKNHKSPEDAARKQLNIYDFYSSSSKLSETSPFKGKMSAFEISVLKGKQSQERRKSMEAATLRSSPRLNSNIQDNPRTAKRSARSLTPSLNDKSLTKRRSKIIKRDRQKRKILRNRSKSLGAVSPSSIENQLVTLKKPRKRVINKQERQDSKKPSSVPKLKRHRSLQGSPKPAKSPSSPTLTYRMNGSPKLKGIPSVLSLSSLSGVPLKVQGSSFSSTIQQRVYANNISGTPPSLSTMKTAALINETSTCVPHSSRPSTLSLGYTGKHTLTATDIQDAFKHSDQSNTNNKSSARHRPTSSVGVEESETLPSSEDDEIQFNFNHTPAANLHTGPKEGQVSRRSSRSSTPNVSPIKTEVLTPSCTPCSTPKKSPSPCLSDQKLPKKNIKKSYLFAKYDDVLAKWHDGLFYVGTILKIKESNQKCLLRYEDNSEYWSLFKDIHRIVTEEEICCICLNDVSMPPNEIVICDHCNQGFHQQCHSPGIDDKHTEDPDEDWFCRKCVFLITAKTGGALKDGNKADDLRKMKQVLPYSLSSLTWDVQHKSNTEQMYCYCGGPGIWYQKMLQCCRCKQWFHEACLQCLDYPFLFGDTFFIFVCSPCNSGQEYIKRLDVEWPDITHIVLFNLSLERRRKYFDLEEEICTWIDENWNCLRLHEKPDSQKTDIEGHVRNVFQDSKNSSSRFANAGEVRKRRTMWGLRTRVPPPRIQVDLPIKDMLNDTIMKKLQIKGRRSKVFIPLECKSPVKKICASPSRANIAGRNLSPHFNEKNDGTLDVVNTKDPLSAKQSKKHHKLPLLDKLIPECPLTSYNHPFKTEIEQSCDRDHLTVRQKIWDSYQNSMEEKYGDTLCDETLETSSDGPPILVKMEPVEPKEDNNTAMPVIKNVKKKGKTDSPQGREKNDDKKLKRRSSRKISNVPTIDESLSEKAEKIFVKKVKSAGGNYFCAYDKLGFGQGFYVCGRRMNAMGEQEQLINWDC